MFRPDALTGQVVAIAGPGGPVAERVAARIAEAGAALVLCGSDAEALDELAWDLAEKVDTAVQVALWNGTDPGAPLRAIVEAAHPGGAALVLFGASGWTATTAAAWSGAAIVVDQVPMAEGISPGDAAIVLEAAPTLDPDVLAGWVVFLLSQPGRHAAPGAIRII